MQLLMTNGGAITQNPLNGGLGVEDSLPLPDCQKSDWSTRLTCQILTRAALTSPLLGLVRKREFSDTRLRNVTWIAEAGEALTKRLTRATLCHLRLGPEMEPAPGCGRGPDIRTKRDKGQDKQSQGTYPQEVHRLMDGSD